MIVALISKLWMRSKADVAMVNNDQRWPVETIMHFDSRANVQWLLLQFSEPDEIKRIATVEAPVQTPFCADRIHSTESERQACASNIAPSFASRDHHRHPLQNRLHF